MDAGRADAAALGGSRPAASALVARGARGRRYGAAGAQATAGLGSAAVAATKWSGVVLLTKWIAVVAVSGVAIAGGVVLSTKAPAPQAPRASAAAPARVVVPEIAVLADAPPTKAEPARPARTSFKRPLPSQPDIRVELAAVDAAMKALRGGNAQEALAALDRYDTSFGKGGSLRVEATALRIEALVRTGDRAKAEALASAFLSQHPQNPYAARVRALIGSPNDPSSP